MLGFIFRKAQNKIQDPAKLRRLVVDLIDKEQWSSLSADVKGDAYEGLPLDRLDLPLDTLVDARRNRIVTNPTRSRNTSAFSWSG
jgi:hypothetical protein